MQEASLEKAERMAKVQEWLESFSPMMERSPAALKKQVERIGCRGAPAAP
ncbi:MAG TPA: hypothetical protein VMR52_05800 [Dehalococcoidia bacterium]|nr:hypothetical protein [Dehalococcoidia bacterium]